VVSEKQETKVIDIGIFSRREIISVAQGKGAWRPPPWWECAKANPRGEGAVKKERMVFRAERKVAVSRGSRQEKQTIEQRLLDNR
jgi:hypothetical protein